MTDSVRLIEFVVLSRLFIRGARNDSSGRFLRYTRVTSWLRIRAKKIVFNERLAAEYSFISSKSRIDALLEIKRNALRVELALLAM